MALTRALPAYWRACLAACYDHYVFQVSGDPLPSLPGEYQRMIRTPDGMTPASTHGPLAPHPRWGARRRATTTIAALADRLATAAEPVADPSLAGGAAGLAVLWSYLDRARPGAGFRASAERSLATAVQALADRPMAPALFGGFTGIAWAYEHLRRGGAELDDDNEVIDDALTSAVRGPWRGDYELVRGLVGLGVYGIERAPSPWSSGFLERVVDLLASWRGRWPTGSRGSPVRSCCRPT